ncbi:MAG: arylsulfatase [Arcanobacterium sp.]|nr:arylsulfatase [Arcanobacterium sp.]
MLTERMNVVLICVDQMRGDAMSHTGNSVVHTPFLDKMADSGASFPHAYSATPTCIPARVALFTGMSQESHGRYGYREGIPFHKAYPVTLPGVLREAGYQTQAIGKMHVYPERSRVGFDDVRLHDGFLHFARRESGRNLQAIDDYLPWLRRQPGMGNAAETDHGVGCNSILARPWDKPEQYHPTNWVISEAVDWLYRRDPTQPFFLYLSFHRPHAPLDPPQWAFDQYRSANIPDPPVGDWVEKFAKHRHDFDPEGMFGAQRPDVRQRAVAGYYGSITHIDHQINRFMEALSDFDLLKNTAFVFTSDHGDMLGDHNFYRKSVGYEGSAHVPFIVSIPGERFVHQRPDQVVELRDVMPTILDIAGVDIPDTVDGKSVLPLVRGEYEEAPAAETSVKHGTSAAPGGESEEIRAGAWRSEIHGEHTYVMQGFESLQWVTDGHRKFLWWSGSGIEQFFNLDEDPQELHDLIDHADCQAEIAQWRERLVAYLAGREEEFVKNGKLSKGASVHSDAAWVRALVDEQ